MGRVTDESALEAQRPLLQQQEQHEQQHEQHVEQPSPPPLAHEIPDDENNAFKPDTLSGILCPVAAIYQHTGFKNCRKTWPVVLLITLAVLSGLVFAAVQTAVIIDFAQAHEGVPQEDIPDADADALREQLSALDAGRSAVALLLQACGILFFFCVFKRTMGPRETEGPTTLGKLCCPVPTVYYHERNSCNCKTWTAALCGCFYTIPCYEPTQKQEPPTLEQPQLARVV